MGSPWGPLASTNLPLAGQDTLPFSVFDSHFLADLLVVLEHPYVCATREGRTEDVLWARN